MSETVSASDQDCAAIAAALRAYESAWGANNARALEALWDSDDDAPMMIVEDVGEPMTDWDDIRDYWRENEAQFAQSTGRIFDVHLKPVARDVVTACFSMAWSVTLRERAAPPVSGAHRIAAMLRRTREGWRFIAWVEAPLAQDSYLRRLGEDR